MDRPLLKGKDVAAKLSVSLSQAHALMRNGDIPTVRFGDRCVRVKPEDLEVFIDTNSTNPLKKILAARTASISKQTPTFSQGDFDNE